MIRINLWHHWFWLHKLREFGNTHSITDHHSRTVNLREHLCFFIQKLFFGNQPANPNGRQLYPLSTSSQSKTTGDPMRRVPLMEPQNVQHRHFPTAISCCRARGCWNIMVLSAVSSRSSSRKLTSVRGVRYFWPVELHFGVGGVQSSTRVVRPVHDLRSTSPGRSYTFFFQPIWQEFDLAYSLLFSGSFKPGIFFGDVVSIYYKKY